VGLGTDVGAGASCSILDSMRQALVASRVCAFGTGGANGKLPTCKPLSLHEVFHLATQGGAEAIGLGMLTGELTEYYLLAGCEQYMFFYIVCLYY
jgi:cytosine/adenosine deaminase-related metal-dependent hydrolase